MPAEKKQFPDIPLTDPLVGPFLQNPGPETMTICWIRGDDAECTLGYGHDSEGEDTLSMRPARAIEGSNDFFYEARLEGLDAGKLHHYSLVCPEGNVASTFRTFPRDADSLTFIYYSDNKAGFEMHKKVASRFDQHDPAFVMHAGDMTDHGVYEEYRPYLFYPVKDIIARVPFFPARGNHEGNGKSYRQVFSLPNGDSWYSFDYGNAHFVVLDTTGWRHEWEKDDIRRMREWLETDLAASEALWTIAMYHEPSYDLGWRKDDWGRKDFLPLMRKHGVDVTLSSHAHGYQRLYPMKARGENEQNPTTHIISAGAGASIGNKLLDESKFLAADARRFNYMVFRVKGETLGAQTFSDDDELLDEFELAKPGGRYEASFIEKALWAEEYPG